MLATLEKEHTMTSVFLRLLLRALIAVIGGAIIGVGANLAGALVLGIDLSLTVSTIIGAVAMLIIEAGLSGPSSPLGVPTSPTEPSPTEPFREPARSDERAI